MPGLNMQGPNEEGPMTGRRMGSCRNNGAILKNLTNAESEDPNKPNVENPAGRAMGWGRGMGGRGRGMGQQSRFRGGL